MRLFNPFGFFFNLLFDRNKEHKVDRRPNPGIDEGATPLTMPVGLAQAGTQVTAEPKSSLQPTPAAPPPHEPEVIGSPVLPPVTAPKTAIPIASHIPPIPVDPQPIVGPGGVLSGPRVTPGYGGFPTYGGFPPPNYGGFPPGTYGGFPPPNYGGFPTYGGFPSYGGFPPPANYGGFPVLKPPGPFPTTSNYSIINNDPPSASTAPVPPSPAHEAGWAGPSATPTDPAVQALAVPKTDTNPLKIKDSGPTEPTTPKV